MFDTNKNYWLYIDPSVYCSIQGERALLYNTKSGENMETGAPEGLELLRSLHEKKNLGAVCCEGKTLMQNNYREFISEFCKKGMGNVADVAQTPEKPIQLMPILNLQRDVSRLQTESDRYTGEEILKYLIEINIYLYDTCIQDCRLCSDYFRQSLCCTAKKSAHPGIMDISMLQNILSQIRHGAAGKINLLGGNLPMYPHYHELPLLAADFKEQVHVWNHYANFTCPKTVLPGFSYDIPVTFPLKENEWRNCVNLLKDSNVKYHFFITCMDDYEKTAALTEEYPAGNYTIHPVYTKENHTFFEENVYISREEIFQSKPSFRRIFANQKLNTHFFGSLTVWPNGEVFANANTSSLGNISTDTLLDIIHREITVNTAWRKIRDAMPCSGCLYQYLCPSPSNYEIRIRKPDLCLITKK